MGNGMLVYIYIYYTIYYIYMQNLAHQNEGHALACMSEANPPPQGSPKWAGIDWELLGKLLKPASCWKVQIIVAFGDLVQGMMAHCCPSARAWRLCLTRFRRRPRNRSVLV